MADMTTQHLVKKAIAIICASRARFAAAASMACILSACAGLFIDSRAPEPFISYRLTLADARLRVVHVSASVYGLASRKLVLRVPENEDGCALDPINFSAAAFGVPLEVEEKDGAWLVRSRGPDLSFEYDVVLTIENRYSPDVRAMLTFVGEDRCRILGRDVFLVPDSPFARGIVVDMDLYPGAGLSASVPAVRARMLVSEIDELPHTMAAAGAYRFCMRRVNETELALAIGDRWSFGDEEFFDVLCRIVAEEIILLGPPPLDRYLFVCDGNPVRGGERFDYYGIHYAGGMLLLLDTRIDRSALMDVPMAVIAHEFFHNWNGEALGGSDGGFLWFTEGATVYCSYLILERANVLSAGQLAARRDAIFRRYRDNPYRARLPIAAAGNSDMADKHMVNMLYDGGYLAAEALDERIRSTTGGAVDLIDVVKRLHAGSGGRGPAGEGALVAAVRDLGGGDVSRFLEDLVHAPDPRPLAPPASVLE